MKIKDIKYDEKKSLFRVNIDEDKFNISYELYEKLDIKIDKEVSIKEYNIIEKEDIYQSSKKIAENYINYKMRTEKEVYLRLKKFTTNEKAIFDVINYYIKLGLLDDKRYANEYIRSYLTNKNYSKAMVKYKLINKGIDSNIIDNTLLEYDDEIELENAKNIFDKKYDKEDLDDFDKKQKVYRYLSSKGFSYDVIKKVIGV